MAATHLTIQTRSDSSTSTNDYVVVMFSRLSSLLDREKLALLQFDHLALAEILSEKVRLLRDLSKLQSLGGAMTRQDEDMTAQQVQKVRTKLQENQTYLERHVHSIGQILNTISAAVESAKSDGTYQRI